MSGQILKFESETACLEILADSLQVDFEEGGPGIFFNDASNPDVKLYTLSHAILKNPVLKNHPDVVALMGKREMTRALRLTGYFLAGCVVVTCIASFLISGMVRIIASRVPMSYETRIGGEAMAELQKEGRLADDTNNVAQLAALAEPLIKVLPAERRNLTFHIIDDFEPNAFALPGGNVVVNIGLLKTMDKPEEVLGVLAHELAHQVKRHVIRKRIAAAGPVMIFGVFLHSNNGVGNLLALSTGLMVFQGFSQEYETEADETGWSYMVAANIDPRGMINALRKLEASEGNAGMPSSGMQAFSSHPATEKRIALLQKKWDKLDKKSGFLELPPMTFSITNTNQ